jgi:5-methylcytosine-specific restriction endonuclease McrA
MNRDHYVPVVFGGSSNIENIVLSCPPCNLLKNRKLPHEFLWHVYTDKLEPLERLAA